MKYSTNNQKGFIQVLFGAIILIFVVAGSIYYFGIRNTTPASTNYPSQSPGNNVLDKIIKIKLLNAFSGQIISNADVRVYGDRGVRCIISPCNNEGQKWTGKSNNEGIISVPLEIINVITTITATGYKSGRDLSKDAEKIDNNNWLIELDPDSKIDNFERRLKLIDSQTQKPLANTAVWITNSQNCHPPQCSDYVFTGTTNSLGSIYYKTSSIKDSNWIFVDNYKVVQFPAGWINFKVILDTAATTTSAAAPSKSPQKVAFMRNGEIWIKDFTTNQEKKISKTAKVESPIFSPSGKHLYYFEIVHAGDGFPRYNLFVSDAQGLKEKTFAKGANQFASKLKWSNDGKYLGAVLFGNDIPGGANYFEEAFIYNTQTQKEVSIGKLTKETLEGDEYLVNSSCDKLQSEFVTFCKEYVAYIAIPRKNEYKSGYKSDEFKNSKYTKPNYHLTKLEKLDNGLVVLEYYTGEPQNPESKWGIGGGVFVPGYDKGVTETYTILLDETTGNVVTEIPLAISTNFTF